MLSRVASSVNVSSARSRRTLPLGPETPITKQPAVGLVCGEGRGLGLG